MVLVTEAALPFPDVVVVGVAAGGDNSSLKASGILPERKSANSGAGVVDRVCSGGGGDPTAYPLLNDAGCS